jgi:nitroreductase
MNLLAKRYGGLEPAGDLPMTPVIELILAHRSVRSFSKKEIPHGMLEALIAAGQSGSTSSNMQTTTVVAIRDGERRKQLSRMAGQDFLVKAPIILCFVADLSRAHRVGERTGNEFFAIPLLDKFIAAANDCAIFGQNVALAAESLGLGVCYIGNLRSDPVGIAKMLDLPSRAVVLFGLCIGYEGEAKTAIRPRLPQKVVLHHEKYCTSAETELLDLYDEVVRKHEKSQGRPAMSWQERHPGRFASKEYLKGREHLRRHFAALGFPLE